MRRADLPVANTVPLEHSDENDELMQSSLMGTARCTWEELKEKGVIEFPNEFPAPWVDRFFERAGGWELVPDELLGQWNQFSAEDEANLGQPRPLVYTSRRQRRKFNGSANILNEVADCLLHPDTAAQYGITDGQRIRVFNKAGEMFTTARLDPKVLPGVCSIPHGHVDANVNNLTCTYDMDPLGGMAHYSAVPIEVEAVD
jgi:anaerobic selenocysteine-containing dehydrogenase